MDLGPTNGPGAAPAESRGAQRAVAVGGKPTAGGARVEPSAPSGVNLGFGRGVDPPVPAAKYRIAAIEIVQDGEWEDPEFLQTLMKSAAAIELPAGATHEVRVNMETSR